MTDQSACEHSWTKDCDGCVVCAWCDETPENVVTALQARVDDLEKTAIALLFDLKQDGNFADYYQRTSALRASLEPELFK